MGYNGSPDDQKTSQKYYNYTKGTDYYLANRYGELKPIMVDITYDGNEFTFTPDYVITESEAGSNTAKITDRSLLSGVTKLMAIITSFCAIRSKYNSKDKKNQQFIIKQDYNKCDVTLYIDYTNNMIFPDDDPDKYKELKNYIFPNNRYPSYSSGYARINLPKDLIKVEYSTDLGYIKHNNLLYDKVKLYKNFLKAFKNEDLINILNKLEIKEQIDIPTKLVIYGVCDKFGKYKGYEGICAILYIEHKVTLDDYIKFKSLCDDELNEWLKPLNLTVDYVKELTPEKLRKDISTFADIEELTMACARLGDPRGLQHDKISNYIEYRYYLYDEEHTYSDDGGLQRWQAIKKYYPELYNGLKIILQYYIKLRNEFDKKFQSEYEKKYIEATKDFFDKTLNSEDNVNVLELTSDIQIEHAVLRYVNKYINSLEPIKINDISDLFALFNILNQNILDTISKIYTNYYKQQIRDYKAEHPKARQITIIFDTSKDILSKGHIEKSTSIFNYEPFKYGLLPKVIQDALNKTNNTILNILNGFKLFYGVKPQFLINNQILSWTNTITHDRKYVINITDALESFEFAYINELKYDNIDDELNKMYKHTAASNIDIKYIKNIINIMLLSEFKLKIKWLDTHNIYNYEYKYKQTLTDPAKNYINDIFKNSVYNGKSTPDSVIDYLKQNKSGGLNDYIYFKIAFDYKNPEIIADKLKNYNLPDTK